jgi:YggT family protein
MLTKILLLTVQAIEIYSYLLLIWVIGSWFPQFQSGKFYRYIDNLVYPYAKLFRGLIPPLGGFDFSVVVAFFTLSLVQHLVRSLISI